MFNLRAEGIVSQTFNPRTNQVVTKAATKALSLPPLIYPILLHIRPLLRANLCRLKVQWSLNLICSI
jgi:hypothetical protein